MIISFSLENWKSFRDWTSFSMVATRERQHGDRITHLSKYKARVLPISAIYGGNAAGKTNFFKALSFVKNFVVRGSAPDSLIPVDPYRLDSESPKRPSSFKLELLIEDVIYELSFDVTQKKVVKEKLIKITSSSEVVLYDRCEDKIKFAKSLDGDTFLHFAFQGTRDNQLFLTNSVSQKVDKFRPVYDWFNKKLQLVAPDTRFAFFEDFIDENNPLHGTMNDVLSHLDTGIVHLGEEEFPFENLPFPEALKNKMHEEVKEGMTVRFVASATNERFLITRRGDQLVAKKLVAFHQGAGEWEAKFDVKEESDGSQRVLDLLPAFLELSEPESERIYVIDEIDRSLHTILIRQLLESYLLTCGKNSRSQLLITTHDVLLMDQSLFRRDEMWLANRDSEGNSTLDSFSDYKDVRYDKDIRKSYLQGRMGGIPKISINGCLNNPEELSE